MIAIQPETNHRPLGSPAVEGATFSWPDVQQWPVWLVMLLLATLALALRLASFTGLIGSDDLNYSRFALAILDGRYGAMAANEWAGHQAVRYGVILPLAAIYKVFGVSEWTTILLPLVTTTLSVVLLAEIARQLFGMRVAIIAGLLYATFPIHLLLGTVLVPEPIAGCYALLGVLLYLRGRQRGGLNWVAAGVLLGVAYLAKESAVFIGGAFLLHAVWERQWRGALLLSAGMISIAVAEHTYYYVVQGDLLFRPHSTRVFSLKDPDNLANLHRTLGYRIFRKYPGVMLQPDLKFGLHSLVSITLACTALALRRRRDHVMLVLWAIVPWLYLNFGSWSLEHYAPVPADHRYIDLVYPPLFLLSGVALSAGLAASTVMARSATALLAVVLVSGVASGVLSRGSIAHAPEMTALREIVRAAPAGQTIYTDVVRWRQGLEILDRSIVSPSVDSATLVLRPNPVGLPNVSQRPVTVDAPAVPQ